MSDLILQMMYAVIAGWLFSSACWFVMGFVHVNWGSPNSFAGIGIACFCLFSAYRNYDFFYLSHASNIDQSGANMNVISTLSFSLFNGFLSYPYFGRAMNWINRHIVFVVCSVIALLCIISAFFLALGA